MSLWIHDLRDGRLVYRFSNGALVEVSSLDGRLTDLPRELGAIPADPQFLLDRANVVHGWLNRNNDACRFAFGDDPWAGSARIE